MQIYLLCNPYALKIAFRIKCVDVTKFCFLTDKTRISKQILITAFIILWSKFSALLWYPFVSLYCFIYWHFFFFFCFVVHTFSLILLLLRTSIFNQSCLTFSFSILLNFQVGVSLTCKVLINKACQHYLFYLTLNAKSFVY